MFSFFFLNSEKREEKKNVHSVKFEKLEQNTLFKRMKEEKRETLICNVAKSKIVKDV